MANIHISTGRAGARVSTSPNFENYTEYWNGQGQMNVFLDNLEPSRTYYAKGLYDAGSEIAVQADYTVFETQAAYFYFENKNDYDITLTVSNGLNFTPDIQYLQGGIWTSLGFEGEDETIDIPAGTRVYMRGDNPTLSQTTSLYSNQKISFSCSDDIYAGGNLMTLLDRSGKLTTLTSPAFACLFNGFSHLKSAPVLPATTLTNSCYRYMFYNCTSLSKAPALPATTLAEMCYESMFRGCTSLQNAPSLPATTLEYRCYMAMFSDCTSLSKAPALPATTLANECYGYMFGGCTALTTPPALPATTLTNGCYNRMFQLCTSLATTPELPATTLANECYSGMFSNCTSLSNASRLPASVMADRCYESMFFDCSSLTAAPALPATTLAKYCYRYMFASCTSLTTAPALPAERLPLSAYQSMFNGCTSLTSSPKLPAWEFATDSMRDMFAGCTSLAEVTVTVGTSFDPNGDGTYAHFQWLWNVAARGTLYVPAAMVGSVPQNSVSGAPTGWNVDHP